MCSVDGYIMFKCICYAKKGINMEISSLIPYLLYFLFPISLDFSEQLALVLAWVLQEEVKENMKSRPH